MEKGRSHPYKGHLGLERKGEVIHTKDVSPTSRHLSGRTQYYSKPGTSDLRAKFLQLDNIITSYLIIKLFGFLPLLFNKDGPADVSA